MHAVFRVDESQFLYAEGTRHHATVLSPHGCGFALPGYAVPMGRLTPG
jgi:hypothetical protein